MSHNIENQNQAMIVLHEIYGKNRFIDEVCNEFRNRGFHVICPDMLQTPPFSYEDTESAYQRFQENGGFAFKKQLENIIEQAKMQYSKVFLVGFSVGATIAWRCCENPGCDGIFGFYGSRIRDYLELQPQCPVFLLFAHQDSFDVDAVVQQLSEKDNTQLMVLEAAHGFIDPYGKTFDPEEAKKAKKLFDERLKMLQRNVLKG